MKNFLYILIISSFINSCSNINNPDTSNARTITLQGNIIKSDTEIFIADTDFLQIIEDKLYIYNPIGEFGFITYDIQRQNYDYLGRKGNGPKEGVLYSPFITISNNDLCLFDISKNKFLYHNTDSSRIAYKERNIKKPNKGLIIEAFELNDSICLVTGAFNTGTCAYLKKGQFLKEFIEPYTKTGDIMSKSLKDANLFLLSNNKKYLLRIVQNGGFIGLYKMDIGNTDIIPLFEKEYFPVECKPHDNTLVFTPESQYGYISACITDKYIYGLYSGEKIYKQSFKGHQIHVYTYEGDLKYNIMLDIPLSGIAIDSEDKKIFGIKAEGEKELCFYSLPNNL